MPPYTTSALRQIITSLIHIIKKASPISDSPPCTAPIILQTKSWPQCFRLYK